MTAPSPDAVARLATHPLLRAPLLIALLLAAVSAAVYWPGLTGAFMFDDIPALINNAAVHMTEPTLAALRKAAFSFEPAGGGRFLAMGSFGLNHLFGGLDPWGYKLGGLLVHLVNALLVWWLALKLLALAGIGRDDLHRRWGAFAIALAWAIHPLQVSTVLYVVQRMETLALTFVLAALVSYVHGRQQQLSGRRGWPWLVTCLPLLALGFASKETPVLFPAYTLALELTVLRFTAQDARTARRWKLAYAAGIAAALLVFVFWAVPHWWRSGLMDAREFTGPERLLTQLRVLVMYLGQIVLPLPARMTFYYDDLALSTSLLSPLSTLWSALLLAGLLALAWVLRRRAPLAALGIFWFFAGHALTSNIIPLELVYEHRNYFALLGIVLVAADLLRRLPISNGVGLRNGVIGALLLGLAFFGTLRSATWGDKLLLAIEHRHSNPQSARAAHELAVAYHEMSDGHASSPFFGFAVEEFERESALPNAGIMSDVTLILLADSAKTDPTKYWDELLHKLRTQPATPESTAALFTLMKNRYNGTELDDSKIVAAFDYLFQRLRLPSYSYVQAAEHALNYAHDRRMALHFLVLGMEEAQNRAEYVDTVSKNLDKYGQPEVAAALRAEAARRRPAPAPAR